MKTVIRPETEMKDSGVEWIKYVPENWNCMPLKRYFQFGKGLPITKADLTENGEKVISYGQIHAKFNTGVSVDDRLIRFVSSEYKSTNPNSLCSKGDIILADTSEDKEGCGNAVYIDCDEKIFAGYHTIILKSTKDNKYLAYLFQSDSWRTQIQTRVNGVKLFSITQKILNQCTIILPPLSEQQAIADYLDETCSKIDEIIAEAKASIDEYKELKQSVIFEAVTKGLDKNVEMKDSGIEWIGRIPKHWSLVKSNRFITSTQNGISRRDLEKSTGNIVLKLRNITEIGEIDYSYTNRIELSNKEFENYILQIGDLLFVRVNGSKALVGKCAIFNGNNEPVAYNDHIIRVQINKFCVGEYFKWYLLSQSGKTEIALHINTSAGQYTISGQGLKDIYVSLPPIHEQENIIMFLGNKCKQIDSLIAEKESLINDLEAYKKSLIYEVVTGKRRVV